MEPTRNFVLKKGTQLCCISYRDAINDPMFNMYFTSPAEALLSLFRENYITPYELQLNQVDFDATRQTYFYINTFWLREDIIINPDLDSSTAIIIGEPSKSIEDVKNAIEMDCANRVSQQEDYVGFVVPYECTVYRRNKAKSIAGRITMYVICKHNILYHVSSYKIDATNLLTTIAWTINEWEVNRPITFGVIVSQLTEDLKDEHAKHNLLTRALVQPWVLGYATHPDEQFRSEFEITSDSMSPIANIPLPNSPIKYENIISTALPKSPVEYVPTIYEQEQYPANPATYTGVDVFEDMPEEIFRYMCLNMPLDSINAFCKTSKRVVTSICNNEVFWQEKVRKDFGRQVEDAKQDRAPDPKTWKTYYRELSGLVNEENDLDFAQLTPDVIADIRNLPAAQQREAINELRRGAGLGPIRRRLDFVEEAPQNQEGNQQAPGLVFNQPVGGQPNPFAQPQQPGPFAQLGQQQPQAPINPLGMPRQMNLPPFLPAPPNLRPANYDELLRILNGTLTAEDLQELDEAEITIRAGNLPDDVVIERIRNMQHQLERDFPFGVENPQIADLKYRMRYVIFTERLMVNLVLREEEPPADLAGFFGVTRFLGLDNVYIFSIDAIEHAFAAGNVNQESLEIIWTILAILEYLGNRNNREMLNGNAGVMLQLLINRVRMLVQNIRRVVRPNLFEPAAPFANGPNMPGPFAQPAQQLFNPPGMQPVQPQQGPFAIIPIQQNQPQQHHIDLRPADYGQLLQILNGAVNMGMLEELDNAELELDDGDILDQQTYGRLNDTLAVLNDRFPNRHNGPIGDLKFRVRSAILTSELLEYVVVIGGGVRQAGAYEVFVPLIRYLNLNIAYLWALNIMEGTLAAGRINQEEFILFEGIVENLRYLGQRRAGEVGNVVGPQLRALMVRLAAIDDGMRRQLNIRGQPAQPQQQQNQPQQDLFAAIQQQGMGLVNPALNQPQENHINLRPANNDELLRILNGALPIEDLWAIQQAEREITNNHELGNVMAEELDAFDGILEENFPQGRKPQQIADLQFRIRSAIHASNFIAYIQRNVQHQIQLPPDLDVYSPLIEYLGLNQIYLMMIDATEALPVEDMDGDVFDLVADIGDDLRYLGHRNGDEIFRGVRGERLAELINRVAALEQRGGIVAQPEAEEEPNLFGQPIQPPINPFAQPMQQQQAINPFAAQAQPDRFGPFVRFPPNQNIGEQADLPANLNALIPVVGGLINVEEFRTVVEAENALRPRQVRSLDRDIYRSLENTRTRLDLLFPHVEVERTTQIAELNERFPRDLGQDQQIADFIFRVNYILYLSDIRTYLIASTQDIRMDPPEAFTQFYPVLDFMGLDRMILVTLDNIEQVLQAGNINQRTLNTMLNITSRLGDILLYQAMHHGGPGFPEELFRRFLIAIDRLKAAIRELLDQRPAAAQPQQPAQPRENDIRIAQALEEFGWLLPILNMDPDYIRIVVNLELVLRDGIEPDHDLIERFNALSRSLENAYIHDYIGLVPGNKRRLNEFFGRVIAIKTHLEERRREHPQQEIQPEHLRPGGFILQNGLPINLPLDGLIRLLALGSNNNLDQAGIDLSIIRRTLQLHYVGENYVQFIERFFGVVMAVSFLTNTSYLNILDDYIGVINANPQLVPGLMAPLTRNQQGTLYNIAIFYAVNRDPVNGRFNI